MLSNQTSNLPPGQHRRQNSTPTVFDTLKVPLLPAARRQNGSHRRGLSLDQPANLYQHQGISPQDDRTVSIRQQRQHFLQETQQQQRQLARPGQKPNEPQPKNDGPLRDLQPKPYPEYDSGTLAPKIVSDQGLILHIKKEFDIKDSYKPENGNNAKSLDPNKFAGCLEGFEFDALDNTLDAELKKGLSTQDALIYDTLLERAFMPQAGNEEPLRPYTPPIQSNTCK